MSSVFCFKWCHVLSGKTKPGKTLKPNECPPETVHCTVYTVWRHLWKVNNVETFIVVHLQTPLRHDDDDDELFNLNNLPTPNSFFSQPTRNQTHSFYASLTNLCFHSFVEMMSGGSRVQQKLRVSSFNEILIKSKFPFRRMLINRHLSTTTTMQWDTIQQVRTECYFTSTWKWLGNVTLTGDEWVPSWIVVTCRVGRSWLSMWNRNDASVSIYDFEAVEANYRRSFFFASRSFY